MKLLSSESSPSSSLAPIATNRQTEVEISVLESQARSGEITAQLSLGRIFKGERGNKIDIVKARKYYQMAAEAGSELAKKELLALEPVAK